MLRKIIVVILIIGLIGGAYGLYLFNKETPSLHDVEHDFKIHAVDLFSDFDNDESVANQKFNGKVLLLSGTVVDINTKDQGSYITLEAGSDFGAVSCKLDSTVSVAKVVPGEEVELKCQCTGYLMDVMLNRCIIVK